MNLCFSLGEVDSLTIIVQHFLYQAGSNVLSPFRRYLTNRCLLLEPLQTLSPANLAISPNLQRLMFVKPGSTIYTHQSHLVHYIKETSWHRQVRMKHIRQTPVTRKSPKNPISPPHSPPVVSTVITDLIIVSPDNSRR